jgi:hypothetical protein
MPAVNNFVAQKGATGDIRNMLLKVFSGEVIKMYDETVKFLPTVKKRTLPKGAKSLQFPIIGSAVADYYLPGANIMTEGSPNGSANYLQKFKQTERLIHLDRVMLATCFIDKFEESLVHFDARSEYTRQMSIALANARDKQILATIIKGARTAVSSDNLGTAATSTFSGNANPLLTEYGIDQLNAWDQRRMRGSVIVMNTGTTTASGPLITTITAAQIMDAIYKVAEVFDLKSVPKTGRYLAITPSMFYTLVREQGLGSSVINRDVGGSGTLNPAPMVEVAGIMVMADNFALTGGSTDAAGSYARSRYYQYVEQSPGLLGSANLAKPTEWGGTGIDAENDYRIDTAAATVGTASTGSSAAATNIDWNLMMLAWQSDAVGAVEAMGLTTESQYLIEYQGDLIVVKQAVGQDVLRPECCIAVVRNRQEFTLGYRTASTSGTFANVDNVHIFEA